MNKLRPMGDSQVKMNNSFWSERVNLIRDTVIPYQWRVLNDTEPKAPPSNTIRNFRIAAKESEGQFQGMVFQDSDVAKWLEAVGFSLSTHPDPALEQLADELIEVIERAQQPNGYLNTYFTVAEPDKKWTNLRDWHELYCAGHLIEGAVAYYEATGKKKILDVVCRLVDHISSVLGPEPGKLRGYPGHEEIELALIKLYRVTSKSEYLELSRYFLEERGTQPYFFDLEAELRGDHGDYRKSYSQSHLPVREQKTAEGHSVRAMYLYCAMADLAAELDDASLLQACRTLWNNMTQKRMYITGGIGSSAFEESFTIDYDLPNDRAYTETCAAIGLVLWAHRMLQIDLNSDYADIMERALYNGVLSGMSLDGTKYFYVNPLEVWPDAVNHRNDMGSVKPTRQGWFGCACCPPNIARLLASIQRYIYSYNEEGVCVHLYANSSAEWDSMDQTISLTQQSNYPLDGHIEVNIGMKHAAIFSVKLRVPGWSQGVQLKVNNEVINVSELICNGYVDIRRTWNDGDRIQLTLPMPIEQIMSHPRVRENVGRVAVQRGPIVFCLEEVDNGDNLPDILLSSEPDFQFDTDHEFFNGMPYLTANAWRSSDDDGIELYRRRAHVTEETSRAVQVKFVPYFSWCNRDPGEMLVWVRSE